MAHHTPIVIGAELRNRAKETKLCVRCHAIIRRALMNAKAWEALTQCKRGEGCRSERKACQLRNLKALRSYAGPRKS